MPVRKDTPTAEELFGLVVQELDHSIHQPNIFGFGQKEYPEQQRFHMSLKLGRFVSGGNRGGKTDATVVDAIWTATDTHPYRMRPEAWGTGPVQLRFVVVDVSKGIEQIILPKMKRWIPKSYLIDGSWDKSWDSKNFIITFKNGSTIDFVTWGMDMMKLGGVPRHGMYFDEEPPQHIFNECMMRLVDYNGYWVIAATPTKGMGWTFDLLWEPAQNDPAMAEMVDTFTLSAAQNPYIQTTADGMNFYMMGMDKEEREVREKGSFVARSGLVFPDFSVETHVVPPFIPPRDWEWYSSADFGMNNPTAWLWHAVSPEGNIVTFAEHYEDHMIVEEHARIVHERETAWGREPDMRVGDPAGNQKYGTTGTSYLMEYSLRGIYIQTEGIPHDAMIGIEKMQQYIQLRPTPEGGVAPTWTITSNCHNLIRELKKLRWKTYSSEKVAYELNKREEVHKKDDHAFDSTKYFFTTRPDLRPSQQVSQSDKVPTTLSYQEMLVRLSADESVEFVDNQVSENFGDGWETTESFEDYYEGELL